MEKEILKLENRVKELKAWKDARIKERLTFPIDLESQKILYKGNLVFTGKTNIANTGLGTDLAALGLGIIVNGKRRFVFATYPLYPYSVDNTTDIFTYSNGNHNMKNGDMVIFTSLTALPTPLSTVTTYYIVNATGTTFQVSTSSGGSPVDITTVGAGSDYFVKL